MSKRLAWLLIALLCGLARADDFTAEKDRLKQQRRAIDAAHTKHAQACHQQFAVNACLEKARIDKQSALQDVRAQELAIEDTERRSRAQAQQERLDKKAQAAQERDKPVQARPAKEPKAPPSKPAKPYSPKASAADRKAAEQQEREAFEARQNEIRSHREQVEKRNAERAKHKTAKPLPVPASGAMP